MNSFTATEAERRPHVLIVDDHAPTRRAIRRLLEKTGLDASEVHDGEIAIAAVAAASLADDPYDAVMMNARMPGVDGWTACREIREGGYGGAFILFSGDGYGAGVRDRLSVAGSSRFTPNPVSAQCLIATVRECLAEHGTLVAA